MTDTFEETYDKFDKLADKDVPVSRKRPFEEENESGEKQQPRTRDPKRNFGKGGNFMFIIVHSSSLTFSNSRGRNIHKSSRLSRFLFTAISY